MNIVFIMADQLRADFLGCYGNDWIRTPNIDQLSVDGIRYDRAMTPSPVCVPARASLLTGLNAIQNGVMDNMGWLRPDRHAMNIHTWPEKLNDVGYYTAGIGKMHFYPWDIMEGLQHRVICEDKRHIEVEDDYADYLAQYGHRKYHGNEHERYHEDKGAIINLIPYEHHVDKYVCDETVRFIDDYDKDQPFAVMVGIPGPHGPYDPPPGYENLYAPEDMPPSIPATAESESFRASFIKGYLRDWNQVDYTEFTEAQKLKIRAYYASLVEIIDEGVGNILQAIERKGIMDETVIIFTADHGDFLGDFDLMGKNLFYETSARIPMIVKHPQVTGNQVQEVPVSLTDVNATMLAVAGATPNAHADCRPLYGLPDNIDNPRDYVFHANSEGTGITNQRWKLSRYANGQTLLFDLKNDPTEQVNLAYHPDHLDTMRELDTLLQQNVAQSMLDANCEKRVIRGEPEGYGQRGWQRPYPEQCE